MNKCIFDLEIILNGVTDIHQYHHLNYQQASVAAEAFTFQPE